MAWNINISRNLQTKTNKSVSSAKLVNMWMPVLLERDVLGAVGNWLRMLCKIFSFPGKAEKTENQLNVTFVNVNIFNLGNLWIWNLHGNKTPSSNDYTGKVTTLLLFRYFLFGSSSLSADSKTILSRTYFCVLKIISENGKKKMPA